MPYKNTTSVNIKRKHCICYECCKVFIHIPCSKKEHFYAARGAGNINIHTPNGLYAPVNPVYNVLLYVFICQLRAQLPKRRNPYLFSSFVCFDRATSFFLVFEFVQHFHSCNLPLFYFLAIPFILRSSI